MPNCDILFDQLQSRQFDALKVKINISNFAAAIQNIRNNIDTLIHKEWQSQQDPQELNLKDNTQSGPSTSKKRRFVEKEDPIHNLRICKEICDTTVVQINERFSSTTHLTIASLFDSEKFKDYRGGKGLGTGPYRNRHEAQPEGENCDRSGATPRITPTSGQEQQNESELSTQIDRQNGYQPERTTVRADPPCPESEIVTNNVRERKTKQQWTITQYKDLMWSYYFASEIKMEAPKTKGTYSIWRERNPNELAHKLSRSFDMKDEQNLLEGEGGMRRHQSMQRLTRDGGPEHHDPAKVVLDEQGNLRITVKKTKPILGIAIEGGANTKHPLPRIININENGAAYYAGGLEVGQLILQVDGTRVEGLQHQDVARLIAECFARRDREEIEFLVVEAKKSNMEPKPTALIFLEA
ncbi:unnamed protein product [Psylliodes chrysocephalus]|uniref:PDZ domain-containing protein n=1 Tax=Psylliodes chrysocephalus TaxID=3402493 RepID=A0A9P0CSV6_9CUCU|nr:unnamed protein product [Psylliodes chrysocephala]